MKESQASKKHWTFKAIVQDGDNWARYQEVYAERVSADQVAEIDKMLKCGEPANGYATYICLNCGETLTVCFRCKSRVCSSCGKVYADDWAQQLTSHLLKVVHRHITLTVPAALWPVLEANPDWRKVLFEAANRTLRQVLKNEPGMVMVLHPYGKDLKVNYHVHVLVTEGGVTPAGDWVEQPYLAYPQLRKVWQYQVLTALRGIMDGTNVSAFIDALFKAYPGGFYVHAKPRVTHGQGISRYLGRYIRHPAIANARILAYDGTQVTFYYDDHDGTRHHQTWSVLEFIHGVVRHIPPKHFKMVRYFGLYAPRHPAAVLAFLLTMPRMIAQRLEPLTWRTRIQRDFGRDPLRCPRCGQVGMVLYRLTVLRHGQLHPCGGLKWLFQRGLLRDMEMSPPSASLGLLQLTLQQLALGF